MNHSQLDIPGFVPVDGSDTWGGDLPFWVPFAVAVSALVVGSVINNWSTFTSNFSEGFAAGSSGNW